MNKEEILAKSRQEHNDEMMVDILTKAGKISSEVGIMVAAVIYAVDSFYFNKQNFGVLAVYFSIEATRQFVKYSKLKEKTQLYLGIFTLIVAVLMIIFHFESMGK